MAFAEQLGDDSWHVVTRLAAVDPFLLSCCHSDNYNQSESTTKFYNSSVGDVGGGNVLTLTSCVLRSDRTE